MSFSSVQFRFFFVHRPHKLQSRALINELNKAGQSAQVLKLKNSSRLYRGEAVTLPLSQKHCRF